MIFRHLPSVLTIMTLQELDLTSLDSLKQSVGAFIDQKKKDRELVPAPPPLPCLDIVYLEEDRNLDNMEKKIPPADQINLPDDQLNETFPNATTNCGYIKDGDYKKTLMPKLQTSVFTVRLFADVINRKDYLSDKDKKEVNECDDCETLAKSKEYYKGKWLERVDKLYVEFHNTIIPVYEQWDALAKDVANWVAGVTDVQKTAFKEFTLEMVLKVFKKKEDFLAYSYYALGELIDTRIKVLSKDKVPALVTGTKAPAKDKDSATKDKDSATKDKDETKEGMSKSAIALIIIIIVAVIIIAGIVCFYLYKTKVQKHNTQTSEDDIEV